MDETPQHISEMRDEAKRVAQVLRQGGVVLYPTDTIWGIGCDASRSDAVKRIYDIKHRADSKAMICLVDSIAMLERYVDSMPEVAPELIEAAVRPLTIVYDHAVGVAPELLAPDGSIGMRVTRDPFCMALCRALRRPLVSTSANVSGQPSAAWFGEISPDIIKAVDYVADYRRHDRGKASPSTVIKLTESGVVTVLRQ